MLNGSTLLLICSSQTFIVKQVTMGRAQEVENYIYFNFESIKSKVKITNWFEP